MNNCPTCGIQMKALLTSLFCPNDCDRISAVSHFDMGRNAAKIASFAENYSWAGIDKSYGLSILEQMNRSFFSVTNTADSKKLDDFAKVYGLNVRNPCKEIKIENVSHIHDEIITTISIPTNLWHNIVLETSPVGIVGKLRYNKKLNKWEKVKKHGV